MYKFDVADATSKCVEWIRNFFKENGPTCNAVLGISGGKDSSVVAALCVEALGKDRVIGVLMPNGEQKDIDMAKLLVEHLGIKSYIVNIKPSVKALLSGIKNPQRKGFLSAVGFFIYFFFIWRKNRSIAISVLASA